MKILVITILLLLLSTTSLAQSQRQKTMISADIRSVMNEQVEAWNRGDIDAFMRGYWKSDDLVFVSNNVTRGWQPTLDRYKKSYDSRAKMGVLSFSDLEVTVLSKEAAVVLGSWALKREKDDPHGKFTLVFRKFKEGWRIVMDHTS